MMLLFVLVAAALLLALGVRIATSPPFPFLGCFFAAWAERCQSGSDLPG